MHAEYAGHVFLVAHYKAPLRVWVLQNQVGSGSCRSHESFVLPLILAEPYAAGVLPSDKMGRDAKLVSTEVYEFVKEHQKRLNEAIDYSRDFDYDYFGFKTLER